VWSVEYLLNSLLMFDEDESTSQTKQMEACCRRDTNLFSTIRIKRNKGMCIRGMSSKGLSFVVVRKKTKVAQLAGDVM
jgi:hypothetical protein